MLSDKDINFYVDPLGDIATLKEIIKRDKAIQILKNLRPGCGEKITYPEGEVCEAIDLAIEALAKQS